MYRALLIAAGAISVAAISCLPAKAVDLQPGLWELAGKSDRDGVTTARPTTTRCITPELAKRFGLAAFQQQKQNSTCSVFDWRATANGAQWRIRCFISSVPIETAASYEADSPQHYKAEFKSSVTIAPMTERSTMTLEGRRIGECPK